VLRLSCALQIHPHGTETPPQCPPLQCIVSLGYEPTFSFGSHLMIGPTVLQSRNRVQFVRGATAGLRHIEVPNHEALPSWVVRGLSPAKPVYPRDPEWKHPPIEEIVNASKQACESAYHSTHTGGAFRDVAETHMTDLRARMSARVSEKTWQPSPLVPCLYVSFANFTAHTNTFSRCCETSSEGAVAVMLTPATKPSESCFEMVHGSIDPGQDTMPHPWDTFARDLIIDGVVCIPLERGGGVVSSSLLEAATTVLTHTHNVCVSSDFKLRPPTISLISGNPMLTCHLQEVSRAVTLLSDRVTVLLSQCAPLACSTPSSCPCPGASPFTTRMSHRQVLDAQDTPVAFSVGILPLNLAHSTTHLVDESLASDAPATALPIEWSAMPNIWGPGATPISPTPLAPSLRSLSMLAAPSSSCTRELIKPHVEIRSRGYLTKAREAREAKQQAFAPSNILTWAARHFGTSIKKRKLHDLDV
jgi:hypothetical protein